MELTCCFEEGKGEGDLRGEDDLCRGRGGEKGKWKSEGS